MSDLTVAITPAEVHAQVKNLKAELKQWERDFLNEHGSKPQKEDIMKDKAIAKKYKSYSKLKAKLQEMNAEEREDGSHVDILGSTDELSSNMPSMTREAETRSRTVSHEIPRNTLQSALEPALDKLSGNSKQLKINEVAGVASSKISGQSVDDLDHSKRPLSFISEETDRSQTQTEKDVAKSQDESNADAPVIVPDILLNPTIRFHSEHPLLKKLSNMDFQGSTAADIKAESDNKPSSPKAVSPKDENSKIKDVQASLKINPMKLYKAIRDPEIFKRIPKGCTLRCQLLRKLDGIGGAFPSFFLINEEDDKFVLAARKRKKVKHPHYLISTDAENLTKSSKSYCGKIKSDASGFSFVLSDSRDYSKANSNNKGLRELVAVYYSRGTTPREMRVGLRGERINDEERAPFTQDIMKDLMTNNANALVLKNKMPRYNEETKTFSMNFNGRVKMASVKNFQLLRTDDAEENIVLQFGRISQDAFALDAFYPLSPLEAFGIALTTFDAFENV